MTRTDQRATMQQYRCAFGLAIALMCGLATMACADVKIEGSPMALRVTTRQDTISDVLSAIGPTFNVKYRTEIPLDAPAQKNYSGTLAQVITRLLDGYNYVIKENREATEIIIFSRAGEPPPKVVADSKRAETTIPPKAVPDKSTLSRWR